MTDRLASAAQLRAAADTVAAVGRRLELDVETVVAAGGPATWRGPAADGHRVEARRIGGRARALAVRLSRLAAALRQQADEVEAAEQAARAAASAAEVGRMLDRRRPADPRPNQDLRSPAFVADLRPRGAQGEPALPSPELAARLRGPLWEERSGG